jgi:hypothetical protein
MDAIALRRTIDKLRKYQSKISKLLMVLSCWVLVRLSAMPAAVRGATIALRRSIEKSRKP